MKHLQFSLVLATVLVAGTATTQTIGKKKKYQLIFGFTVYLSIGFWHAIMIREVY
jgi:hypothetical protein